MAKRRGGFSGWLSRFKNWQLVLGFIAASIALGTGAITGLTGFERRYGVFAANFGFARTISVARDLRQFKAETKQDSSKILEQLNRIQLWQLYDQIKRTQRNIDNLKEKKALTPVEREQLQDFGTQLTEATSDYQKLVEKVKRAQ